MDYYAGMDTGAIEQGSAPGYRLAAPDLAIGAMGFGGGVAASPAFPRTNSCRTMYANLECPHGAGGRNGGNRTETAAFQTKEEQALAVLSLTPRDLAGRSSGQYKTLVEEASIPTPMAATRQRKSSSN